MQNVPQSLIGLLPSGGDDTAAIVAALSNGSLHFAAGTFSTTGNIAVPSNAVITAAPGATLQLTVAGVDLFNCTGKSGVTIRGLYMKQTAAPNTSPYVAAVDLTNATDCKVEDCTVDGFQWAGVWLNGAQRCRVTGNRFLNWQGTIQDAADVVLYNAALDNVVDGNYCYGGGEHGILVQDPYSVGPLLPQRNIITNNQIGQHTGYGVAVYLPARSASFTASISGTVMTVTAVASGTLAVGQRVSDGTTGASYGYIASLGTGTGGTGTYNLDTNDGTVASTTMATSVPTATYNRVADNHIRDIQGSYATNTSSGAGIYVVGDGANGTLIANNTISNCCVQTANRSLAPGGIGVAGIQLNAPSVVVTGNVISGMPQYDGITVTSSPGGAVVTGNAITVPAANTNGYGISVFGASGKMAITGNRISMFNAFGAISLQATGGALIDGAAIANNVIDHTTGIAIQLTQTSSGTLNDVTITGNRSKTNSNTPSPYSFQAVARLTCVGNTVYTGTQPALVVAGCTSARFANNVFASNGTTAVNLSGTNTFGSLDKSNLLIGNVVNSGTGLLVEQLGTAAPGSGTAAVGDTIVNTAPAATASTDKWRCTTAGSPGTWTAQAFP